MAPPFKCLQHATICLATICLSYAWLPAVLASSAPGSRAAGAVLTAAVGHRIYDYPVARRLLDVLVPVEASVGFESGDIKGHKFKIESTWIKHPKEEKEKTEETKEKEEKAKDEKNEEKKKKKTIEWSFERKATATMVPVFAPPPKVEVLVKEQPEVKVEVEAKKVADHAKPAMTPFTESMKVANATSESTAAASVTAAGK